ncbi:MAG: hypothetical protein JWO41_585 [Candidatus Saccharibacteria bacterium]|nr:hypothetical protein [Candidatus Saccharibacteria bacterium]
MKLRRHHTEVAPILEIVPPPVEEKVDPTEPMALKPVDPRIARIAERLKVDPDQAYDRALDFVDYITAHVADWGVVTLLRSDGQRVYFDDIGQQSHGMQPDRTHHEEDPAETQLMRLPAVGPLEEQA